MRLIAFLTEGAEVRKILVKPCIDVSTQRRTSISLSDWPGRCLCLCVQAHRWILDNSLFL